MLLTRLKVLIPYLRPYRRRLLAGLAAIAGSVVVGLFVPLLVGRAIDTLWEAVTARGLLLYGGLLVAVTLVQGVFTYLQRIILVTVSRSVEYDIRNQYFAHLSTQPQGFFQDRPTGDLMARATQDLEAVRQLCGPAIMYSTNTVLTATGSLIFMLAIHLPLTLVALSTMPLVALATKVVGARIHRLFTRVQERFAGLSARVQENLAGVRVVRAYAQEDGESEIFRGLNQEYVEANRRLILWTSIFHPLLQGLVGIGFVGVLGYGGLLVVRQAITVGEFVTFNFFLTKLIWPMIAIGWVINLAQRGTASLERIRAILDTAPTIVDEEPSEEVGEIEGAVSVRGLDFAFGDGGPRVLSGLRFEAPAGTTVAVVGRTGAGKSTLLSLLPRVIDPPSGTVLVDGRDVRRLPLAQLRSAIGMVPQESFLFSTTLRENIAFARPDASDEEVDRAMRLAGLEEDLAGFPQGLETMVGERGITLSGGQKQRVALARALLREPRILILDDCLSAVDTHTEEKILEGLRRVFVGRTVFLVSHRISTVKEADLILVLDGGEIVERGNHQQLLAHGGLYADLHQRQQLEEELAAV